MGSFVFFACFFAFPLIVSSGNSGSYGISLVDCTRHQHDKQEVCKLVKHQKHTTSVVCTSHHVRNRM